jgi:HK97 family phage portal protein
MINPLRWIRRTPDQQVRTEPPLRAVQTKVSAAGPVISFTHLGLPVWTPHDYGNFARESYNLNAVAFRCIKMIASAMATADICLYGKGGKEIEQHPLLDLLNRPNPVTNGRFYREAVASFLLIAGNSYQESVGPSPSKPPKELWFLRPDRMKVIAGSYGTPKAFEYMQAGMRVTWDVDQLTGQSDILHLREFNPLDDWYGMSRVQAAGYSIDRHNAASAHNKALLDNGARPSGALIFQPISGLDGPIAAPPSVIAAAEKELNERHAGAVNAGKPMVFGGSVTWEQMGLSQVDMDFGEGKADAARDICTALGVPHILVVPGTQTYNNVKEAKLELYEDTVLPLLDEVVAGYNHWLCPRFGDGLILKPDLDSISALESRREVKRNTITTLLEKGVIDDEEARAALDYGPRVPGVVKMQRGDSAIVDSLVNAVNTVGLTPLFRYLKSVGLVDEGATEADIMAAAMAIQDQAAQNAADAALPDPNNPQDPNADPNADPNKQPADGKKPADQGAQNDQTAA